MGCTTQDELNYRKAYNEKADGTKEMMMCRSIWTAYSSGSRIWLMSGTPWTKFFCDFQGVFHPPGIETARLILPEQNFDNAGKVIQRYGGHNLEPQIWHMLNQDT